jgi:hypothetical protein
MSSPSSSQSSLLSSKISPTISFADSESTHTPKKDFLSAFGALQSIYGLTGELGASPAPVSKEKTGGSREIPNLWKRLLKLGGKVLHSTSSTLLPPEPLPGTLTNRLVSAIRLGDDNCLMYIQISKAWHHI